MTQFMVETLTVILFVLVFYHLPRFAILSDTPGAIARDAVMALAFGALITIIVSIGSGIQLYPKISDYFIENSLPLAHGRNIVNAILVDFRGFDTFGEITVLAVAAIGVYALLKLRPEGRTDHDFADSLHRGPLPVAAALALFPVHSAAWPQRARRRFHWRT